MTVQEEVRQRFERDPELVRLRKKIDSGKATSADTASYSIRSGKLLGEILSRRLPDIPPEEREALFADLFHDRYIDINAAVDIMQQYADAAIGIHLAPQHPKYDEERARQIGSSTADPTVPPETQQRRARSATETAVKSMHDDRMKAEARFRSRAGLKCRITRTAVGGCCPWCSEVAGRYEYGEEPDDIYRRHDNCDCTVTFENGRQRQDVWSKRTWEVPGKDAGAAEPTVLTAAQAAEIEAKHQPTVLTNGRKGGIIESEGVKPMIRSIEQPIEQQHTGKGNPNAILTFDVELNNRQAQLLAQLPEFDSRVIVPKNSVNMADLSALTAKTGHEFAMFTRGQERLIIRGNSNSVNIDIETARQLAAAGYRWSGHTHPGDSIQSMIASGGDVLVLAQFSQSTSVIYNSKGQYATFGKEE